MIAAIIIAFLSSAVTYWQAGRVLPLFDYSYQVENAYRLAVGQVPYRDFILITTPLMHYLLALFMRITGYTAWGPLLYMLLTSFAVVLLTYWILSLLRIRKGERIIFILPLVFAAHGIVPLPSYDVTATLFILLCLGLILQIVRGQTGPVRCFITGMTLILPALSKQNIGLAFAAATYLGMLALHFLKHKPVARRTILITLAGSVSATAIGGLFLAGNHALMSFIRLNRFVFLNRDPVHYGLAIVYDVIFWKNLLIYLPLLIAYVFISRRRRFRLNTIVAAAAVILSFAIIPGVYFLLISKQPIYTDPSFRLRVAVRYFFSPWYVVLLAASAFITVHIPRLKRLPREKLLDLLVMAILLVTTAAAFLAQGVGGSTFGIYPFFFILMALLYRDVPPTFSREIVFGTAVAVTAVFLAGFTYLNIRQSYVPVTGRPQPFTSRSLMPLGTPGPWASELDGMLRFVGTTIPQKDSVVALPGEDPFYFATGRKPQLRYFELFSGALPYTPERIAQDIIGNSIGWLVVKTHMQSSYYMDTRMVLDYLKGCYILFKQVPGYSIYRRTGACHIGQ